MAFHLTVHHNGGRHRARAFSHVSNRRAFALSRSSPVSYRPHPLSLSHPRKFLASTISFRPFQYLSKMATPKIIKKYSKKFKRHHSDRYHRVSENWRKQKGIDSCVRRRFRGSIPQPNIGYGSDKRTKFMTRSGHKVYVVRNVKDLDVLLMHEKTHAAEIAHAVSAKNRVEIVAKAKALGVKVTNPKGRVSLEA